MIIVQNFFDDLVIAYGKNKKDLVNSWQIQAVEGLGFVLDETSDEELENENSLYDIAIRDVKSFQGIKKIIRKINKEIDTAEIKILEINDLCEDEKYKLEDYHIVIDTSDF